MNNQNFLEGAPIKVELEASLKTEDILILGAVVMGAVIIGGLLLHFLIRAFSGPAK